MRYSNTKAAALTLNINSTGEKPIYINGAPSSATNYTLPAGTYLIFYDGTNYYFNTTADIPNLKENLGIPNGWSWDKTKVEISNLTASGNKVADITIDGTTDTLYAPAYSGTSPISISGTSISHSNSGVSANTYGVTATTQLSPAFGTSFSVPGFTVNATGHVTAAGAHNVQLPSISFTQNLTSGTKVGTINIGGTTTDLYAPSNTNTWDAYGGATASAAGTAGYISGAPANALTHYFAGNGTWRTAPTANGEYGLISYEEKQKLAGIATGADAVSVTQTVSSGTQIADIIINGTSNELYVPVYSGTSPISISGTSVSHANSGVTANTYGTTATTGLTPDFGDSFSVPGFTVNATGHITAAGSHDIQLPAISVTQELNSGTKIGTINVNGTTTDLYSPKMVVLSYGSSTWAQAEAAYNDNAIVYCKASSNSNPASGAQGRMAFLAYVNNASAPTEFEFQYYRSIATHSDSQQGDQVFVYKLNKTSG